MRWRYWTALKLFGIACILVTYLGQSGNIPKISPHRVSSIRSINVSTAALIETAKQPMPNLTEVYPSPAFVSSSTYSVTVNGQSLPVEKYNSISYVRFGFAGEANIKVQVSEPVSHYVLSPKSSDITSITSNNTISFTLTEPKKLILHDVNTLGEKLFILADPIEPDPLKSGIPNLTNILNYGVDPTGNKNATTAIQKAIDDVSKQQGMLYFPPGIYQIQQLNLKSNMILYLAPGAVLEATKEINPSYGKGLLNFDGVSNVKIAGFGTINGNGSYWRPRGGWYSLLDLSNTSNINLQGITLKDSCVANVWIEYSEDIDIENIKILSDANFVNTDGFDFWSSRNITIDNVLYKGTDDATSVGGDKKYPIQNTENINIKNSVFYTGGGFKLGTGTQQDFVRNITYENIDVVHADELAGFWPITGANFENIFFKNIRVEDITDHPQGLAASDLFQFRILVGSWEPNSSPQNLGYIRNVYINNLMVDDPGSANSIFEGYDAQRDIRVNFDNFYIAGKPVLNPADAYFDIRNQYVNLKFTTSNPTIVGIKAEEPYVSENGVAHFQVYRSGDRSQPLTLQYDIMGTADNGIDYKAIADSVTIPAGSDSTTIDIYPNSSTNKGNIETVILRLENLPNQTTYLLDSHFQAVINII